MSGYARTLTGEYVGLVVEAGQHTLVRGSVDGAVVREATVLTLQGALIGDVQVEYGGTLLLAGALLGTMTIAEGGKAVVQGALIGEIHNSGELVLDAPMQTGEVTGSGRQLGLDGLAPELRAQLPTVTMR